MKVTLAKKKGSHTVLGCLDLETLADQIRTAKYDQEVTQLRRDYVFLNRERLQNHHEEQISRPDDVLAVPSVCFAGEYRNHGGVVERVACNPLFLVEVNRLDSYENAEYLRDMAAQLPFTLMTFMGATGRSVKIICQARNKQSDIAAAGAGMSADDTLALVRAAYADASKYYAAQLHAEVDIRVPSLEGGCKVSADPHLYYNPHAQEFFVTDAKPRPEASRSRSLDKDEEHLLPGYNLAQTRRFQFQDYLGQAIEANMDKPQEQAEEDALVMLAHFCHDDGLPIEMCVYRTLRHPDLGRDEKLVRMIFNNAYRKDILKGKSFSHLTPEILLTLRTQAFMENRYELRRNTLTGVVEYRPRDGRELPFKNLTQQVMNSMTQDALMEGLKSWDKDMQRYINSDKIKDFDPVNDYLEHLPAWDGIDRIGPLAALIPTDNPDWQKNFHVWMLSMVAHWMDKDPLYGNAYIPMLVGPQGYRKSSFCKRLLPPELSSYYYDRLDFKTNQTADISLTRYALINIDEYDQLTPRQQALLKYLLQKSEVKTRRPYGVAIEEMRRYASFIATTNSTTPLADPSGSRRYLCIQITGPVDYHTAINHAQVYAQAVSEINAGARYWFDDKETAAIMKQNEEFQVDDGLNSMIHAIYEPARSEAMGQWIPVADIMGALRGRFHNLKDDVGAMQQLGKHLKELGFMSRRGSHGTRLYFVHAKNTIS